MNTTRRPQLHKKIPILSRDTLLLPRIFLHLLLQSRTNAIMNPRSENTTDTKDITTYINQTMGSHVRTRKSEESERAGEKLEPKLSRRLSQIHNNPNNCPQTTKRHPPTIVKRTDINVTPKRIFPNEKRTLSTRLFALSVIL